MMRKLTLNLVALLTLAACSNGSTSPAVPPTGPSGGAVSATPSTAPFQPWVLDLGNQPYSPTINPGDFTDVIDNPYFPLTPGTVLVYDGNRDGVPRHTEVTITSDTKTILGVQNLVVRDIVTSNGALVEKTSDWYAQDTKGNVWYFGEDTKEYTNGVVSSTAGTWLAGVDEAIPGIVMEAVPKVGDAYRQEYRPGVAEDMALVQRLDGTSQITNTTYTNVLVTEDADALDPFKLEHKSYAPGVGFIGTTGIVGGHHEVSQLTQILTVK